MLFIAFCKPITTLLRDAHSLSLHYFNFYLTTLLQKAASRTTIGEKCSRMILLQSYYNLTTP